MTQHNLYKNLLCKNELWLQCRASKLGAMEMRGNTIQDTNQSLVASISLYNIDDHFSFPHFSFFLLNMKIMLASLLKMLHLLGEQKKKISLYLKTYKNIKCGNQLWWFEYFSKNKTSEKTYFDYISLGRENWNSQLK